MSLKCSHAAADVSSSVGKVTDADSCYTCRAAANCYCQLLASQSDNNVKLIVLDRLQVRAPTLPALLLTTVCRSGLRCYYTQ